MPTGRGFLDTSRVKRIVSVAPVGLAFTLVTTAHGWARAPDHHGAIRWHDCRPDLPASLQCNELAAPLDRRDPGGAKIRLGFNRLPVSDRAQRVCSLIVDPGGPGGAGRQLVALEAAGAGLWHPALHRRFDRYAVADGHQIRSKGAANEP